MVGLTASELGSFYSQSSSAIALRMNTNLRNRSNFEKSSKPDRSSSQPSGTTSSTTAAPPSEQVSTPQAHMARRKPLFILILFSAAFILILWKVCHLVIFLETLLTANQIRLDSPPPIPSPFEEISVDQLDFSADSEKQSAIVASFRVSCIIHKYALSLSAPTNPFRRSTHGMHTVSRYLEAFTELL